MKLSDIIAEARNRDDWRVLVNAIPYARLLNLRIDVEGDKFTCTMPFDQKLTGNPMVLALHGGATSGFLECAATIYLVLHTDSSTLPQTIDLNVNYLRPGRPRDTYASVVMLKHGPRIANLRVHAWQASPDKPIAIGQGNFMLGT